ncbi:MAG TPA: carboxylating nicotinate-nucleotide diphosphorylase [Nitrospiraceae bacterium]|nr:carboxylating nicotinate-nucleotide diphosphorylase [Nitrospiraceae bacterium]
MMALPRVDIRRAVRLGLEEDLAHGDITTAALFSEPTPARAKIIAQQPLVVAGMTAAIQTFIAVDASLKLTPSRQDGSHAKNGDILLQIEGDGRSILMAERVALNFLQYLCGIATLTNRFCRAVHGYPVDIMDTRKTLPGWRAIQKWAVSLGGGTNHRVSLGDGILIKDNHLALINNKKSGILAACRKARARASKDNPVIVEVESLSEVRAALRGKADIILLDNMTPPVVKQAVKLIDGRALVEVSGGITLKNVRAMAAAGPDRISIGALTHSAPAATLSLVIEPRRPGSFG